MDTTPRTANQRLADVILGRSVDDFVTERREGGKSWRLIARDLYSVTDGQVDVTAETLRSWYPDAAEQVPA